MPHTNPWNVTDPPGSELGKNIDDHIRKLRVDIGDRFADIMVDVMADPVDLTPPYKGNVIGKKMIIPFSAFNSDTDDKEANYDAYRLQYFTDTHILTAPVILSPGCTITLVEVLLNKLDATSVDWDLFMIPFVAGGTDDQHVSLFHKNEAAAGRIISSSGLPALAVAISNAAMYYIGVDAIGPAGYGSILYGARVTYDTPDCRNTI